MIKSPLSTINIYLALGAIATSPAHLHAQTMQLAKPTPPEALVDFAHDVRPILSANCFSCHGADSKSRQAGLRLDNFDGATQKLASGKMAIVVGHINKSSLVSRISTTGQLRMPPVSTGKVLTNAEISVLKRWIAQGAKYSDHWAFTRVVRPSVPVVNPRSWVKNPVDAFLLSRVGTNGLKPNPTADRHTLARRLALDLTGLPTETSVVEAFVNNRDADAYEKFVDKLLDSPHFGEKWARMWMDIARYADSAGYGSDPLRPNIWPWRNWVINAFNNNMPFDQFTIEQLAGDLLPKPTEDQLIATAFHRNTMTNTEGGTDREEFRTAAVKDRTITTVQTWMGLTMGCAQCHTHKFDPITQTEFYRFSAFFNQTSDNDQPDESPTMPVMPLVLKEKQLRLQSELTQLKTNNAPKDQISANAKELEAVKPVPLPIMRELPAAKQRKTHLLTLSNFLQPAEEVSPGTPSAFHSMPPSAPLNRLGVAKWLVSHDNPLTARVTVNRFWAHLFGRGIVETEEDFGYQGTLPTHPELLDWLASEFMDSGWNVKAILKTIVMSNAYRQSSKVSAIQLAKDPKNFFLMRYPRRRLDAETVRDQALSISGLLSNKVGGPSVFPLQPAGMWQAAFNGDRNWPTSTGEDRYRRGLYTFLRRTVPYPSMAAFDAPSREVSCIRRINTNTPLQALVTMNDPVFVEMSQAFARDILTNGGTLTKDRVAYALRKATGHPASADQIKTLMELLSVVLAHYTKDLTAASKMATEPLGPAPKGMEMVEMAAWTVVANTLLNLDGVLTNG